VDLKHILADVEFVEYQRRDFLEKAMVEELGRRAGGRTVERASSGGGSGGRGEPQPE
jgi:hypothetical protein